MNVVKLNCPSCGGALEVPDNLTVAHCLYCGSEILLDQDGVVKERRDLLRYIELCKVAVEAKNHNEVIEYCNRILELDSRNIEAWINKALSTFWLTTVAHNRYNEAMEYLIKALQIAPNDAGIVNARESLTTHQVLWLMRLALEERETANRIWKATADSSITLYSLKLADDNSRENAIRAMNYYLAASDLAASNYAQTNLVILELNRVILEDIAEWAKEAKWIQWNEKVYAKIETLELLRSNKDALDRLPKLKEELQKAQSDLAKLRTQSGFFLGGKIKDAVRRISQLQADIAKLEKNAS